MQMVRRWGISILFAAVAAGFLFAGQNPVDPLEARGALAVEYEEAKCGENLVFLGCEPGEAGEEVVYFTAAGEEQGKVQTIRIVDTPFGVEYDNGEEE